VPTYVSNVTLFDGRTVKQRAGVLVADGRVRWVGRHARATRSARAADEIEGRGKTLTPGLIDCHVHLCFDGSADFAGEAREMTTDAAATVKAVRNAARTLDHGVTSVRTALRTTFTVAAASVVISRASAAKSALPSKHRWTWQSINPGVRVLPRPSIWSAARAERVARACAPTHATRPSSASTPARSLTVRPSNRVTFET